MTEVAPERHAKGPHSGKYPDRRPAGASLTARTPLGLLATLLTLVAACGPVAVGTACRENADCPTGLYCDRGATDGYCTTDCEKDLPCPERAVCVAVNVSATSTGGFTEVRRCLRSCNADPDCREGYACKVTPAGEQKVCYPR